MNKKLTWKPIYECDDEDGKPHVWCAEINHHKYGKYVWINDRKEYFAVEVDYGSFIDLVHCKSLASAKRWVAIHLVD